MFGTALAILSIFYLIEGVYSEKWDKSTYGKDWVAFMDEDGTPLYVNLTLTPEEVHQLEATRRQEVVTGTPKYFLYTRENPDNPEELTTKTSKFYKATAPLLLITHGWMASRNTPGVQQIKNAVLTGVKRDVNVVVSDWRHIQSKIYVANARATQDLAEKVASFVLNLISKYKIDKSKIQFIGHSIGAHILGRAGVSLKRKKVVIPRVTGLDPARPFFEYPFRIYPSISKESGEFVDIIHTSSGFSGLRNPAGHADFYPGGGRKQPACCQDPSVDLAAPCEHNCAYTYYEKSYTLKFEARKCSNYQQFKAGRCKNNEMKYMGEPCTPNARGSFYLDVLHF